MLGCGTRFCASAEALRKPSATVTAGSELFDIDSSISLIGMAVVEWIAGDSKLLGSPITLRGKGEGSSFSGIRNDVIDSSRYVLASLTMSFQSLCALFRDF